MEIVSESIITCPKCSYQSKEKMSTDSCQWLYECKSCKEIIKPLEGHCCVFCSYGSVKCPPMQEAEDKH